MLDNLGRFLFRTRNLLFPAILVALLAVFPPAPLGEPWVTWLLAAGLAILAAGQIVRVATIGLKYVKRGGMKGRVFASSLVTTGMFSHCRNPMYVGNLAIVVGLLLVAGRPAAIVLGVALYTLFYAAIVRNEESYLATRFGDDFRDYCERVPRWRVRLKGIVQTFRSHTFDWRTVLVKEYGTVWMTVVAPAAVIAWKAVRGGAALADVVAVPAAILMLATIAFLAVRALKKSARVVARQDTGAVRALDRPRAAIDEIDAAIVDLLNRRAEHVSAIYDYKRAQGIQRFDGGRTEEILRRVRQRNRGPLRDDELEQVFTEMLRFFARRFQSNDAAEATPLAETVEPDLTVQTPRRDGSVSALA